MALDKANKRPVKEPEDGLIDHSVPFGAHEVTDEEIADHDLGLEAGLAAKPNETPRARHGSAAGRTRRIRDVWALLDLSDKPRAAERFHVRRIADSVGSIAPNYNVLPRAMVVPGSLLRQD